MLYHNDITRIDFGTTLVHFAHHAKRMMLIVKSMQVLQFFHPRRQLLAHDWEGKLFPKCAHRTSTWIAKQVGL